MIISHSPSVGFPYQLGVTPEGAPIIKDFFHQSNLLILGDGRSGMPSLRRSLLDQLTAMDQSAVIVIDPLKVEFPLFGYRAQDIRAINLETATSALTQLTEELSARASFPLEEGQYASRIFSPIFVFVNSPTHLLPAEQASSEVQADELLRTQFETSLFQLLEQGTAVNIFVILELGAHVSTKLVESLAPWFSSRIVLGLALVPAYNALILGSPVALELHVVGKRGLGLFQQYGSELEKFIVEQIPSIDQSDSPPPRKGLMRLFAWGRKPA